MYTQHIHTYTQYIYHNIYTYTRTYTGYTAIYTTTSTYRHVRLDACMHARIDACMYIYIHVSTPIPTPMTTTSIHDNRMPDYVPNRSKNSWSLRLLWVFFFQMRIATGALVQSTRGQCRTAGLAAVAGVTDRSKHPIEQETKDRTLREAFLTHVHACTCIPM